jgi:RNA polymerase sigma factor (sigma-70 family)
MATIKRKNTYEILFCGQIDYRSPESIPQQDGVMSSRAMRNALDWVRLTLRENEAAALSDAQLLEAFLEVRDETAFAAIVRRHGPMVLGVCKRFLRNHHDAEDAFQAVFLVFMNRADSIRPKGQLANWLYGVAFKTACKTRAYLGKRRLREWSVANVPERGGPERQEWGDFWLLLDQELNQLPDKYRAPIVLCDLEGKSRREAAHALGLLDGTLSGRLSRARRQLAARLSRRGVSLSGAALAAALLEETASASLPAGLVVSTTKTVFALACKGSLLASSGSLGIISITKGVLRSMVIAKVWQTSAVLIVSTLAVGAGASVMAVRGGNPDGAFGQTAQSGAPASSPKQAFQEQMDRDRELRRPAEQVRDEVSLLERKAVWDVRLKEYLAGRGTLDRLLQCASELMDAERIVAKNPLERVAACQAQVDRVLPVYEIVRQRYEANKVPTQDLAQATGAYESARAQLIKERSVEQVSKPPVAILPDSKILIDELVAAANAEWEARLNEYNGGRGTQTVMLACSKRLHNAELKKASSSEGRLHAHKEHFDRMRVLTNIAKTRFEAGNLSVADVQEANFARIEAELELVEAANKSAAGSATSPVEIPSSSGQVGPRRE